MGEGGGACVYAHTHTYVWECVKTAETNETAETVVTAETAETVVTAFDP